MRPPSFVWLAPAGAVLLLLIAAAVSAQPPNTPLLASPGHGSGGDVFTMTNAASGNRVLAFHIGPRGALIPAGSFSTRGTGTGATLADAGSLALTPDHEYLLVVNAGDSTISSFRVHADGSGPVLTLVERVSSRGTAPVSLTVHGSFVYVLNEGNATRAGNIAGFLLADHGLLFPLPHSRQPLSQSSPTGAAQISFDPSGTRLVVTEELTSVIDVYAVDGQGIAHAAVTTASNGSTPYGFAFTPRGNLVVSDAGSGALTSYRVLASGRLHVETPALPDGQLAACWVAIAGNHWAFTSNAHSGTIGAYHVSSHGALTLRNATAATTGAGDTDLAIGGPAGQYLFVYVAGAPQIQEYAIGAAGTLNLKFTVDSLPATTEGLAAD